MKVLNELIATELVKGAVDLFFPADCLLCRKPLEPLNRSFICFSCWQRVEWLPTACCPQCAKPLSLASCSEDANLSYGCLDCQTKPPHFLKLFSPTVYRGVMVEAIKLFKYRGKRGIVRGFIRIIEMYMHRSILASLGLNAVVPVPLHLRRLRERGFNQAEDLAKVVSGYLELPVWNDYLLRLRYTRPQASLKKQERKENLKDAFSVRKKAKGRGKGKKILLVDDVYTTGVTLNEASHEMKREGAEVFSFTLARAPGL